MYELIQITDHDYYIDCPAKIGVVKVSENEVVLIDSGSDKDTAKKILKILEEKNWSLKAVFNTHSHADHIGGNRLLQDRTGCKIFAKGLERTFTENTILESSILYGGNPLKELKNKFLMAQESVVSNLNDDVLPEGMKSIDLSGHCFEMTGFITKDKTAFIADSISSENTLSKYGIGYLWDAKKSLETLEKLKALEADVFVPSHAEVINDISHLIKININAIEGVKSSIVEICNVPQTFENLLKLIFEKYGMTMSLQQYALIGSTVKSYISSLNEEGRLIYEIKDNCIFFKSLNPA